MQRIKPLFPLLPLFLVCCACGGNSRHLQSISISPAIGTGTKAAFTASGTYNAPPMNVSPVAVSWFLFPEVDPPPPNYSLSNAAFVPTRCPQGVTLAGTFAIVALAPTNPAAPVNGKVPTQVMADLVFNRTATAEDGFVAASAQLKCQ
ncbi:MAG TPA: hypothetical protein VGI45_00705 [Terracidiphilus sp.]|jgi:hypothetical protein